MMVTSSMPNLNVSPAPVPWDLTRNSTNLAVLLEALCLPLELGYILSYFCTFLGTLFLGSLHFIDSRSSVVLKGAVLCLVLTLLPSWACLCLTVWDPWTNRVWKVLTVASSSSGSQRSDMNFPNAVCLHSGSPPRSAGLRALISSCLRPVFTPLPLCTLHPEYLYILSPGGSSSQWCALASGSGLNIPVWS